MKNWERVEVVPIVLSNARSYNVADFPKDIYENIKKNQKNIKFLPDFAQMDILSFPKPYNYKYDVLLKEIIHSNLLVDGKIDNYRIRNIVKNVGRDANGNLVDETNTLIIGNGNEGDIVRDFYVGYMVMNETKKYLSTFSYSYYLLGCSGENIETGLPWCSSEGDNYYSIKENIYKYDGMNLKNFLQEQKDINVIYQIILQYESVLNLLSGLCKDFRIKLNLDDFYVENVKEEVNFPFYDKIKENKRNWLFMNTLVDKIVSDKFFRTKSILRIGNYKNVYANVGSYTFNNQKFDDKYNLSDFIDDIKKFVNLDNVDSEDRLNILRSEMGENEIQVFCNTCEDIINIIKRRPDCDKECFNNFGKKIEELEKKANNGKRITKYTDKLNKFFLSKPNYYNLTDVIIWKNKSIGLIKRYDGEDLSDDTKKDMIKELKTNYNILSKNLRELGLEKNYNIYANYYAIAIWLSLYMFVQDNIEETDFSKKISAKLMNKNETDLIMNFLRYELIEIVNHNQKFFFKFLDFLFEYYNNDNSKTLFQAIKKFIKDNKESKNVSKDLPKSDFLNFKDYNIVRYSKLNELFGSINIYPTNLRKEFYDRISFNLLKDTLNEDIDIEKNLPKQLGELRKSLKNKENAKLIVEPIEEEISNIFEDVTDKIEDIKNNNELSEEEKTNEVDDVLNEIVSDLEKTVSDINSNSVIETPPTTNEIIENVTEEIEDEKDEIIDMVLNKDEDDSINEKISDLKNKVTSDVMNNIIKSYTKDVNDTFYNSTETTIDEEENEKPTTEQSIIEEPTNEEPITEEPITEQSIIEEPTNEESTNEELTEQQIYDLFDLGGGIEEDEWESIEEPVSEDVIEEDDKIKERLNTLYNLKNRNEQILSKTKNLNDKLNRKLKELNSLDKNDPKRVKKIKSISKISEEIEKISESIESLENSIIEESLYEETKNELKESEISGIEIVENEISNLENEVEKKDEIITELETISEEITNEKNETENEIITSIEEDKTDNVAELLEKDEMLIEDISNIENEKESIENEKQNIENKINNLIYTKDLTKESINTILDYANESNVLFLLKLYRIPYNKNNAKDSAYLLKYFKKQIIESYYPILSRDSFSNKPTRNDYLNNFSIYTIHEIRNELPDVVKMVKSCNSVKSYKRNISEIIKIENYVSNTYDLNGIDEFIRKLDFQKLRNNDIEYYWEKFKNSKMQSKLLDFNKTSKRTKNFNYYFNNIFDKIYKEYGYLYFALIFAFIRLDLAEVRKYYNKNDWENIDNGNPPLFYLFYGLDSSFEKGLKFIEKLSKIKNLDFNILNDHKENIIQYACIYYNNNPKILYETLKKLLLLDIDLSNKDDGDQNILGLIFRLKEEYTRPEDSEYYSDIIDLLTSADEFESNPNKMAEIKKLVSK